MNFDLKTLVDGGLINEETRTSIQEAWEAQITEARSKIAEELREEFAQKYEHDKGLIIESLDKMVSESLRKEIEEFASDKRKLAEDRVKVQKALREHAGNVNKFVTAQLQTELKELREDREKVQKNFIALEKFVINALSEEIAEFAQDKKNVVETRVKLVKEATAKFEELKKTFVKKNSARVAETVTKTIKDHMSQFKEDIEAARQNNFGRKIFEAFVHEYSGSLYNERGEVSRLLRVIEKKEKDLAESRAVAEKSKKLVESREVELARIRDRAQRTETLNKLTANLNASKKAVMLSLLEGVQTAKLQESFKKYLPSLLNEEIQAPAKKEVVAEGKREMREVTGDKQVQTRQADTQAEVVDLKKLAGIN